MDLKKINCFFIVCFGIFSYCVVSCTDRNKSVGAQNEIFEAKLYYPDGSIRATQEFINGVENGILKEYYPNGNLRIETHYKDGKREGKEKGFYESGSLEYTGYYKDSLKDGTFIWYHENGGISGKYNYFKNNLFGEQIKYYPNGSIYFYSFNHIYGHTIYIREYDKNGKLISEGGKPLFTFINKSKLSVNEPFEVTSYLPAPPNCEVHFHYILKEKANNKIIEEKKLSRELIYQNGSNNNYLKYRFRNEGEYLWLSTSKIIDTITGKSISGQDTINITVQKK